MWSLNSVKNGKSLFFFDLDIHFCAIETCFQIQGPKITSFLAYFKKTSYDEIICYHCIEDKSNE